MSELSRYKERLLPVAVVTLLALGGCATENSGETGFRSEAEAKEPYQVEAVALSPQFF
jgi:outer membrane lipoprotein SlyB